MTIKPHDFLPISTKVLVVDDEPDNRQVRSRLLKKFCAEVIEAGTEPAAWKCIAECVASDEPIIVLLDLQLATGDTSQSLEFIKKVSAKRWIADGYCGVMVMSAYATAQEKLDLFANSALGMVWDKIEMSPTDLNLLLAICERDLSARKKLRQDSVLPPGVLGNSTALRNAYLDAAMIATTKTPEDEIPTAFIRGETGTGKEALARYIHEKSGRGKFEFVPLSCARFSANPELFLQTIYGSMPGGFTGAEQKAGSVESAGNGTLFLDDLQALPIEAQQVLLRSLTDKKYARIGEPVASRPWNAMLIVSYNKDPDEAIKEGKLLEDLYYRLAKHELKLPALRDRGDDVLLAAAQMLSKLRDLVCPDKNASAEFDQQVRRHLLALPYPGNFRALEKIIGEAWRSARRNGRTELRIEDFVAAESAPPKLTLRVEYEVKAILLAIQSTRTRDDAAELFGLERAQFYRKIKEYKAAGLLPKDI